MSAFKERLNNQQSKERAERAEMNRRLRKAWVARVHKEKAKKQLIQQVQRAVTELMEEESFRVYLLRKVRCAQCGDTPGKKWSDKLILFRMVDGVVTYADCDRSESEDGWYLLLDSAGKLYTANNSGLGMYACTDAFDFSLMWSGWYILKLHEPIWEKMSQVLKKLSTPESASRFLLKTLGG